MNKKAIIFSVIISLLVVLSLFIFPSPPNQASAQTGGDEGNVVGWMWSANVGWVKADANSTNPLKVGADGKWQGYAWSSSLGWIDFNPVTSAGDTYPGEPQHGVQTEGNNVTGWARLCSIFKTGCSGAFKTSAEIGGWNGWVKMVNVTRNPATGGLEGFAWGDLNLGWLQFGCFKAGGCDVVATCPSPLVNGNCCPDWQVCDGGGGGTTVSCSVEPESGQVKVGEPITFTAKVTGASASSYVWVGDFGGEDIVQGEDSITVSYPTEGTKVVNVTAKDAGGATIGTAQCHGTADDGGVIVEPDCVGPGQIPTAEQPCCGDLLPIGPEGACSEPEVEACTISLEGGSGRSMFYWQLDGIYNENAPKVHIKINNCEGASGLSLIPDVYNDSSLDENFNIVCSDPNQTDKPPKDTFNADKCSSLVGGNNYWVWAKPLNSLPEDYSSFGPNKFNIKLQRGEKFSLPLWVQLYYRQSGTP